MPTRIRHLTPVALAFALALAGAGCGEDETTTPEGPASRPAPAASSFPQPGGRSLEQLLAEADPTNEVVVSPAGAVYEPGRNRFAFGVFTVGREQITDVEVAIYASHEGARARGPFPARIDSLETNPAFEAQTTADDPDAAKVAYVTELPLDRPGEWQLLAMIRDSAETVKAARVPSVIAGTRAANVPNPILDSSRQIPQPGDAAPSVHTPTVDDVGDIAEIDTRVPHDTMHDIDLADVLGERPVVLLFATPALCVSRVCGPVVDVAEQVKAEYGDEVAFIHMEIYEDNDPNAGPLPQVRAYGLPTEPWLFVIDRDGRVSTRIEGPFSPTELEQAVQKVAG